MVNLKSILAYTLPIPILFTVGVLAFFVLFPSESQTLNTFVSYISSLSTILMVLIVVITTSLQRREMENTRLLQTQPLPIIIPSEKSYIEELRFFYSPDTSTPSLDRRIFFCFNIENIGNAPAIAVKIAPRLIYTNEEGKFEEIRPVCTEFGYLKQGQKEEDEIMFIDPKDRKMTKCIMNNFLTSKVPCIDEIKPTILDLAIFFKNVLGASFREDIQFLIYPKDDEEEKIKSALKLTQNAEIDYRTKLKELGVISKKDENEGHLLLHNLNKELASQEGSQKLGLEIPQSSTDFSVKTISNKEFQKQTQLRLVQPAFSISFKTET